MTYFIDTKRSNPKTQKNIELKVDKRSIESYRTQTQIGQTGLFQRRSFEEAVLMLEETIEDMDKKVELKVKKLSLWPIN